MKLSDLKIAHIIFVILILLWAWLFFDWQKTKYQLQFEAWRGQITQAINILDQRLRAIEQKGEK